MLLIDLVEQIQQQNQRLLGNNFVTYVLDNLFGKNAVDWIIT